MQCHMLLLILFYNFKSIVWGENTKLNPFRKYRSKKKKTKNPLAWHKSFQHQTTFMKPVHEDKNTFPYIQLSLLLPTSFRCLLLFITRCKELYMRLKFQSWGLKFSFGVSSSDKDGESAFFYLLIPLIHTPLSHTFWLLLLLFLIWSNVFECNKSDVNHVDQPFGLQFCCCRTGISGLRWWRWNEMKLFIFTRISSLQIQRMPF